jgi:alpha-N-arabinofuranosidase
MTNIAQMTNVLQAMVLTDGPKMVLTPTYHVYKLYVPFQDATLLPVSFDGGTYRHGNVSMARIDAVAARDTAGKIWLAVTNIDPDQPGRIRLNIAGLKAGAAAGEVLTAARVDAVNTFASPNAVVPKRVVATVEQGAVTLDLSPKSVTVLGISQ